MVDLNLNIDVTSSLTQGQARKVLAEIFNSSPNFVSFSKHGLGQMLKRNLKTGDVLNVLKGGKILGTPEFENCSWRYRVETNKITAIIAFRKPNHVIVITAWRS